MVAGFLPGKFVFAANVEELEGSLGAFAGGDVAVMREGSVMISWDYGMNAICGQKALMVVKDIHVSDL